MPRVIIQASASITVEDWVMHEIPPENYFGGTSHMQVVAV
jgi:hypothetical protein